MKTQIKKIVIMAIALLFVSVGVSFAHDWNNGHPKARAHAYRHFKKWHDRQHGWHHRHHKTRHYYRDAYRHRIVHKARHGDRRQRYDRHAHRGGDIIAIKVREPGAKFAVILKGHK